MRCPNHAVAFVTSHGHSILGHFELGCAIVQRQQDRVGCQGAVQPAGNRFTRPVRALVELLAKWCVRIWFGENVAIAVFVERVLQRIAMGRQFNVGRDIRAGTALLSSWSLFATGQFSFVRPSLR